MADIGKCVNNTGLKNEITAAYIYMKPKKTLGIKGPRNTIEISGFKWKLNGHNSKYEAYTINHDIALCITPLDSEVTRVSEGVGLMKTSGIELILTKSSSTLPLFKGNYVLAEFWGKVFCSERINL